MKVKNKKIWKVYIHTNKVNGKTYIGITRTSLSRRWNNGQGYRNQFFYRAIKKYGWDGFKHEIIADNLTEDEAKELEIDLITLFHSKVNEHGYNITDGGDSSAPTLTTKVCKVDYHGNVIATYDSIVEASEHSLCKTHHIISCCRKKAFYSHGEMWRYERDCKDKEALRNEIISNPKVDIVKPIYQFDLNNNFIREYSNCYELYNETHFNITTIIACCNGKLIHTQGYRWAFKDNVKDINNFKPRGKLTNKTKKLLAVVQLDFDGNYINTFTSAVDAGQKLNLNSNVIRQCCHGAKKSSGGYQWLFEKDYDPNKIYKKELKPSNGCAFLLLDNEQNIIAEFSSIGEATRQLNHSYNFIVNRLNNIGVNKTPYIWVKKEKYTKEVDE